MQEHSRPPQGQSEPGAYKGLPHSLFPFFSKLSVMQGGHSCKAIEQYGGNGMEAWARIVAPRGLKTNLNSNKYT